MKMYCYTRCQDIGAKKKPFTTFVGYMQSNRI